MLRRTLIVPVLTLFLSGVVSEAAAHEDAPSQTVTVNPVEAVNGFVSVEYEHALGAWFSVHGGLNVLAWDGAWLQPRGPTVALGPEAGVRWFLLGTAPEGLWLGPYLGVAYVRVDDAPLVIEGVGAYAGAMAGATVVAFHWLAMSVGAGATYNYLTPQWQDHPLGLVGWTPRLRLAVGIAF